MATLNVKRICLKHGCHQSTYDGYCDLHQRPKTDTKRNSAAKRGYGRKWQAVRAFHLRRNPLCAECERQGRTRPATVVDHVIPHKGDVALFHDQDNWQSLCERCHNRKSAGE